MTRRRFDDDERDEPRPRPRAAAPVVLILAILAGLLMLVVVGGGIAAYVMVSRARHAEEAARAEAAEARAMVGQAAAQPGAHPPGGAVPGNAAPRPMMTRAEFEKAVMNKTKDQVIAAVGRPDDTTDQVFRPPGVISFLAEYWYFRNRVMNPDTGKPYPLARVYVNSADEAYLVDYP